MHAAQPPDGNYRPTAVVNILVKAFGWEKNRVGRGMEEVGWKIYICDEGD